MTGLVLLLRTLPEAVDPTWERMLQTGVLRLCTDPSWPPFEFVDNDTGEIVGLDADLAELLASRLAPDAAPLEAPLEARDRRDRRDRRGLAPGVRAEMVTAGFDGLYDALLTDRCDAVLSALPYEPLRTEDVAFSMAYFNAGQVLVTPEETHGIEEVEDLADLVVGVEWGFVPEGDSQQRITFDNLNLRRYDTSEDTLRALHSGEVEAVVVDRISALAYLRDCSGLKIAEEPVSDLNYVLAMRTDSFRLLEEINRALNAMRESGELEALLEKWF